MSSDGFPSRVTTACSRVVLASTAMRFLGIVSTNPSVTITAQAGRVCSTCASTHSRLVPPDVPAFKRNCVQFMTELHRPELDFDRLERVIKQEVALAVATQRGESLGPVRPHG